MRFEAAFILGIIFFVIGSITFFEHRVALRRRVYTQCCISAWHRNDMEFLMIECVVLQSPHVDRCVQGTEQPCFPGLHRLPHCDR
jgi:hypothetical protein